MGRLLTRKYLILAAIVLGVLAIGAVLVWTALRGGKASIEARQVRAIVSDEVLADWSEALDVTEDEARSLYSDNGLEEKAEEKGLSRDEFLSRTRAVLVETLNEAVRDDVITSEQAERALRMSTRAVANHL